MMKPRNYVRGRCRATNPQTPAADDAAALTCRASFPCAVNIFVLAGLDAACEACAPHIGEMRRLHGYAPRGAFFGHDGLTPDQQREIDARIAERTAPPPEALTGIPDVDLFLDAVPTTLWDPDEATGSGWYGFPGDGQLHVINAFAPGMERNEAMDLKASWVIGYVKTKRPVALVMVSEMFVRRSDEPDREPVDCDRFEADEAYRAEVLKVRREVLGAFVETLDGTRSFVWPIVRENGTRRLGPREDRGGVASGRFVDLLRKSHAHDTVIGTADGVKEPLRPEPVEAMRERFRAAPLPTVAQVEAGVPSPSFDGADLRVLLTATPEAGHVAVVAVNFGTRLPTSEFVPKVVGLFNAVTGHATTPASVVHKIDGAAHAGVLFLLLRV